MKPILPFLSTASKRVMTRSEVPRQGGHRYQTKKTFSYRDQGLDLPAIYSSLLGLRVQRPFC